MGVQTFHIEPGSPWENGYKQGFNGKPRDELLNGEVFYRLKDLNSDRKVATAIQNRQIQ